MARSILKTVLRKKRDTITLLGIFPSDIGIMDEHGTVLVGNEPTGANKQPIQVNDQIYGWVFGSETSTFLAVILSQLVAAELENTQLADEMLDLYREVNLMYTLSDRFANTLDIKTVARMVMDEAIRMIDVEYGIVLLKNELSGELEPITQSDAMPDLTAGDYELFFRLLQNGKSDIVNDVLSVGENLGISVTIKSLLFAVLSTSQKQEVFGAMILFSTQSIEFKARDLNFLVALASQAAAAIENVRLHQQIVQEEIIRSNFLRQFSPKVADNLINNNAALQLGGNRVEPITLLISDVRGFTALSATMKPDEVVGKLNGMFSRLVPIIFKYDGTIDKFVGDAILAVFGSPEPDENQWQKAVLCALEMQAAVKEFDERWRIGIGVHTGEAVHGFIGSTERMEYTVIGDTVNRASRFCDGASGGQVLISRDVYGRIGKDFVFSDEIQVIKTKHPEREPDLEGYLVLGVNS